jgi:2-dehydro-3-deoxyphosphogluconate aldolase/(4S)-4-hydroxy-2-oxoglutarate aldolase
VSPQKVEAKAVVNSPVYDRKAGKARATINDVARLAGVSKKTVSRVLNQSPSVRPETRARVHALMQELDYRPDPQARGLAFRRRSSEDTDNRLALERPTAHTGVMQTPRDAVSVLTLTPVIPVVTIEDAAHAGPLSRVLLASGVRTVEITLRTPAALDAIRAIVSEAPEMRVGAGTILSAADLDAAAAAGAHYALSPGGTPKLMKAARKAAIPFIPGVASASEIMRGLDLGYTCFKFFPAEQLGGVAALKALAAPLAAARFCPTGSISLEKAPAYLALSNVLCVGGSWIAPAEYIKAGDWASIEAAAKRAVALKPVA